VEALVLGDGTRLGLLQPAPVVREAANWVTRTQALAWAAGLGGVLRRAGTAPGEFLKQAVAAVDERTTETCLRVHGQVTAMGGEFRLTGTPRFADRMAAPPFHWFCRTATALVRAEDADDELTREMRQAAGAEIVARERATLRVLELQGRLAAAGAAPDARARAGDSARVRRLRGQLREARGQVRVEIHPASATSRRQR